MTSPADAQPDSSPGGWWRNPATILGACALVALVLEFLAFSNPAFAIDGWIRIAIGASVLAFGGGLIGLARRGLPAGDDGEAAAAPSRRGVYGFTRNPELLGMALLLAGAGFVLDVVAWLLAAPVAVAWMHVTIVRPEELRLAARYGDAWRRYAADVRRWI